MLEHIKSSRSAALESNQQEQERIVSRKDNGKDMWQQSLRPKFFRDYIGQETLRNNLSVYIEAAKKRKEALDHVLLYGPDQFKCYKGDTPCLKKYLYGFI